MSLTGNVVNARLTNYRRGFPIEIPIEISIDHWYRIYYCMYLSNLMNSARPTWSRCCSTHTRHACTYTRHRRDYTRVYNIYIYTYMSRPRAIPCLFPQFSRVIILLSRGEPWVGVNHRVGVSWHTTHWYDDPIERAISHVCRAIVRLQFRSGSILYQQCLLWNPRRERESF